MPILSLSIVSHGHSELVSNLLSDLDKILAPNMAEVIITLNLPGEDFDLKELSNIGVRIIRNLAPRGFGENHNRAFETSSGEYFCVMNPDLRSARNTNFGVLLSALQADPLLGMVAPIVVNSEGRTEDSVRPLLTIGSLVQRAWFRWQGIPIAPPCDNFFWLAGMFMLFKSDRYRALGGFSPRYYLYCEDFDICARMFLNGMQYRVIEECSVIHLAQRSSHRKPKYLKMHLISLGKVYLSSPFWRLYFRSLFK